MKSDIIGLSDNIRKNGFLYTLLNRTDKAALYQQADPALNNQVIAYEVFLITIQRGRVFNGRVFPTKERFPSNEDFGKTAWSYGSYEKAHAKYVWLIDHFNHHKTMVR